MNIINKLILTSLMICYVTGCSDNSKPDGYSGYVESDYLYIGASQAGWLKKLKVKEGDELAAGQPLFSLDQEQQQLQLAEASARLAQAKAQYQDLTTGARQQELDKLRAELEQANADLALAQIELKRSTQLLQQKLISQEQYDQARTQLQRGQAAQKQIQASIASANLAARPEQISAAKNNIDAIQAQLEQINWQLQQRSVQASQPARVVDLLHFEGEFVNAGQAVVVLETIHNLKIRFFVPQAQLAAFKLGQSIYYQTDGEPKPHVATISYISNQAEFTPPVLYTAGPRQKLVFMLEARPQNTEELHAGLPVDVQTHE